MASFKPLALALFLFPVCASAQESTAPEFHSGQWALQFGGNLDLVNFGIMRFSGPRSAWMLNLDVAGQFLKGTVSQPGVGVSDANDHNLFLGASVGRRFYQSIRSKIRSFQGIGITGGYSDQQNTFGIGFTTKNKQWFGGLQGQVGGAYWFSSNLSLGGTASLSAAYTDREATQSGTGGDSVLKQHGMVISGVDVGLVLGIYF